MIHRILDPSTLNHSFFLFGARGTGKSTLIKNILKSTVQIPVLLLEINLLKSQEEKAFLKDPAHLEKLLEPLRDKVGWVFIDEIQKVPALLNTIHDFIENSSLKFALTGSSTRKLKKEGVNLLAGRAFVYNLFPLTHNELKERFVLNEILSFGSLPKLFSLDSFGKKKNYLKAYADTYLREEIRLEQLVKKLEPFVSFLEIAAQSNGEIVNFSKVALDCGVDTKTVQTYFQILVDTLTGFFLKPYLASVRKRERHNPKFYFFDLGVKRALENSLSIPLQVGSPAYGRTFEHFIISEIVRLNSYAQNDFEIFYWRGEQDAEVDVILKRPQKPLALIEIKSSHEVSSRTIKNLTRIQADFGGSSEAFIFYNGTQKMQNGKITIFPWQMGFKELGIHA